MRIWPRGGRAFLEVSVWRSSCEYCMETKEHLMLRCSCLLVRVIRCGVSAKVLLKATLICGSRLGCFTNGWLTLLEFMVQFMWIVVLCCSARMAFPTPFPMLRISECRLCVCQNAKFEALQHAPSLVISWLSTSLSLSYLVRTGLAARHRHSHGKTYRLVDTEACVRSRAHTHTRTHARTHILWHTFGSGLVLAAITCLGRPYMSWEFVLILAEPRWTGWWLRLVMSALRWWYMLLTWSITGVACRACHSSGTFFIVTHTRARAKTHARSWWRLASAGYKSLRLVLIFWQNLTGHGDDVWLACVDCCACCWFGTVASSWQACLRLNYLPCLATQKLDFFFFWQNLVGRGGDLHLVMSVIWISCAWKYRLPCFKCHFNGPVTLFSLCFTCSMHTHPF